MSSKLKSFKTDKSQKEVKGKKKGTEISQERQTYTEHNPHRNPIYTIICRKKLSKIIRKYPKNQRKTDLLI